MLYAMFAMVTLTFIVGFTAFIVRVRSVRSGAVRPKAYLLVPSDELPELVTKTTRNFNNQFEVPLLFYVVCTLYITLGLESSLATSLAWVFVCFRFAHAYIHITYNHLLHRVIVYWSSALAVLALWVMLLLKY